MTSDFKNLLTEYVALRSVSTDPQYKGEMLKTAEWIKAYLQKFGFTVEFIQGPTCNPIVFGSLIVNPDFQTVLIYGHYDVQPSDQFDLKEIDGRLVGRGVVDNKGQNLIHIYTVCKLASEGKLKYNIKFLIEGNEETGNDDMSDLLRLHKDKLKSDIVLVSDGEIINDRPTIEASLRGGFNVKLIFKTAKNNVHSGIYGGAIPNAAFELAKFVSGITPITVGMDEITADQISNNASVSMDIKTIGKYDFFTQTGLCPTIEVSGFKSGYIDTGFANIVPATAEVRLNFRIVTSQKPQDILKLFESYVASNTPKYVEYEIKAVGLHNPVKLNTSSELFITTAKLLEGIYGKPVFFQNVGGAIPFISDIKEIFGVDTLSVALANSDCNMHGDNENFRIDLIDLGLQFSERFFSV
ncbi:MAG: M20/M25/M40 family metallo-hydrolase [Candidatus Amesbacteria bacterium]|nr:M20/M25/M40 family metallo-hydrolase [Candidatus Amesbacteria bacterium]